MQILKKLLFLLGPNERKQAGLLLMMIIFMALLDMVGVASILPFVAVLTNPNLIETNSTLNFMKNARPAPQLSPSGSRRTQGEFP